MNEDGQSVASSATPAPAGSNSGDTSTPSAADQAIGNGDFSAFRAAKHAERAGKPLTPDAASSAAKPGTSASDDQPAASSAAKPETTPNRTERRATENRVPDLLAERALLRSDVDRLNARIKELEQPKKDDAPASSAAAPKVPDHKRFAAMPDAPKVTDFDTIEEYTAAMSVFIADKRYEERQQQAKQRAATEQQTRTQAERLEAHGKREKTFTERVNKVLEIDGKALDGIDTNLLALRPSITLKPGQPITFGHVIADQLLQSDHPVELMRHLSDPAEQRRLAQLAPDALLREIGRIEAGFGASAAASTTTTEQPSTTTTPPPPPTTLGGRATSTADPVTAAVARRDFGAFRRAKRDQLVAGTRR